MTTRIGVITFPGSLDDRDAQRPLVRGPPAVQLERVLGVEPHVGAPRQHTVHPAAGDLLQPVEPRLQQRLVATELVDDEAGHQPLVGRVEQRDRPVHRGEHAAAIDVADDDDRHVRVPGEAHVDVVAGPQVDLGRAAGALAQDDVEPRR